MRFSPEIEAFRREVRDFVEANLPDDIRRMCAEERMDLPKEAQRRWAARLANVMSVQQPALSHGFIA